MTCILIGTSNPVPPVIPLAKKLDECGVFGVTSDECLNYAMQNRLEWHAKGVQIVKEMVERVKAPKRQVCRAARRNSFGYMARRSATFMMPTKAASAGEVAWANESSNYDASLDFSRDCMDASDRTDKTIPTEENNPPVAPTLEGDSDDDDSIVIEA